MQSSSGEYVANIIIGIGAVWGGVFMIRPRHALERRRLRYARKMGLAREAVDARFKPLEGVAFNSFRRWIGLAVIILGVSRLCALFPDVRDESLMVTFIALAQVFIAMGLTFIFTGKATLYDRKLGWESYSGPKGLHRHFTDKTSWFTSLHILMLRIFGVVPLAVGLAVSYLFFHALAEAAWHRLFS